MGKRSNFERKPRDFYPTPYEAVVPLIPHLEPGTDFHEPCAGNGQLTCLLESYAGQMCMGESDICPQPDDDGIRYEEIYEIDALKLEECGIGHEADIFITNPPWSRDILHPLITHLSDIAPTWLLFDADWMHTKQSAEFMPRLRKIVSVGRVKWIPDSKMTGKDNCCWYLFDKPSSEPTIFYGRE